MRVADAGGAWEPRVVALCCQWCSYAGADLAGTSRLKYPANIRVVRVPCSSRVNPSFVLRAFALGADGVLVAGCHPGDCHYTSGNYFTRRRLMLLQRVLEYVGVHPARLQVRWISAAEGAKFATVATEMVRQLRELGPFREEGDAAC